MADLNLQLIKKDFETAMGSLIDNFADLLEESNE